ncbi:DAACS family dicarboxylate/amino acid:cation (Na+ or H+) symporter [Novosphingobium fluoreni]|uniref:DAACS family dicarboxylate/amino acid:cation (Na+ or H+) symporter n=1 Tax=Novosphingobium fluoreni TaxID=1391222 RepID=A0A7W6C5A6_9SPHN|nr:dicarboxylate/amino acid:cation symporter [Novosphingobium fluoreni]KTR82986.1 sodium:dicarboxylate symporter [Novosphingobium barchaimii]MBB3940750.1 DAACS family dicarboxylate/amino acid:cation (Na+ or H+) symporter [Novosphingobium fluoreni]
MTDAPASDASVEAHANGLQWRILIGFIAGLGAGLLVYTFAAGAPWVSTIVTYVTGPIGQIFLRLLFMLVLPLLFSALVLGIAEMGEIRALRRVGIATLLYTIIVSGIAVVLSLTIVNVLRPGAGVDRDAAQALLAQGGQAASGIVAASKEAKGGVEAVLGIVPTNVITAMSQNDILAVMFFALFFGIGILLVQSRKTDVLKDAIEGVFQVAMKLINIVIQLAPFAIFCFMFNLAAQFGWDLLFKLAAYVGVVLLALALQTFGVFSLLLAFIAKKSPIAFFRETREASLMAFSTASSNATLPTSLRVAEDELKLPTKVSRFVLTIGATANQNGTAMFEGVTVLFLAQFFGVSLDLGQQIFVMLVCILAGVGTAGVPAGSLPVIALILNGVGVPPEGIGLILGVDRFLDMCRTTLNVIGDLVAATVISAVTKET